MQRGPSSFLCFLVCYMTAVAPLCQIYKCSGNGCSSVRNIQLSGCVSTLLVCLFGMAATVLGLQLGRLQPQTAAGSRLVLMGGVCGQQLVMLSTGNLQAGVDGRGVPVAHQCPPRRRRIFTLRSQCPPKQLANNCMHANSQQQPGNSL